MNVIFDQLESILDKYFLEEKVFIVPSHRDGKLAIQGLVRRGKAVVNASVKTFQDLAIEQVEPLIKNKNLSIIPREVGKQYIYEALTSLKKDKELAYFKDVQFTPSFCHAFYQTILDLKQVKVNSDNFPSDAFLKKEKGEDIKKVFSLYEENRIQASYIDTADLFQLASQSEAVVNKNCVYIFFPHEAYHLLEKEFFLKYTSSATVIPLAFPEVEGLEAPPAMIKTEDIHTTHVFRHIFTIENSLDEELPLFTLKAVINEDEEIQSVFRRVKEEQLPFDQTVIFYPNQRPYIESMLRLMAKHNIPVTFAEGIPIDTTKPGKLLKGMIRWVRDQYSVTSLIKVLREGLFSKEALPLSAERMIKLLKECEIRFGKERYLPKIAKQKDYYIHKQKLSSSANMEQRIEDYTLLYDWIKKWLSLIPATNMWETVDYKQWLLNVEKVISDYASDTFPLDKATKEQLAQVIEEVAVNFTNEVTLREAIAFTEQWLLALPVGASMPKPGHIHISPYRTGLYIDRPNVFIVGMDSGKFPGRVKEDPLLLDRERRKIHNEMTLGKALVKRNLYLFVQLLLTTSNKVEISFPFMDTVENRGTAPSHLFLQLYRMRTKNPDMTGEDLLTAMKNDVHFIRDHTNAMLHPTEWFAKQIWDQKRLDERLLEEGSYQNIVQGFTAREARYRDTVSEYDGLINYEESVHDPRENEQLTMSTSKFELLGSCAYAYFMRHVLRVEDEEEVEFDRYRWLDAATRGNVLHGVFERFYKRLIAKGEKPNLEKHLADMMTICDQLLADEREVNPPPSEMVFELEREEMLESCSLFLKAEEEASLDGEPLFFEYSFGMGGKEPAVIELTNGKKLRLSGKIDRVDRLPDGTYSIVDYKTGSTYGYGEKDYFNGGRKLQHTLYALAFEKLFDREGHKVSTSVYVFPTLKGQGERVHRHQSPAQREKFIQIVDQLCNYLKEGHFPFTDTADDCKFCEYKIVCNRHSYGEELLTKKRMDENAQGWLALGEVRSHD